MRKGRSFAVREPFGSGSQSRQALLMFERKHSGSLGFIDMNGSFIGSSLWNSDAESSYRGGATASETDDLTEEEDEDRDDDNDDRMRK